MTRKYKKGSGWWNHPHQHAVAGAGMKVKGKKFSKGKSKEKLSKDVKMWHRFRIRKDPDKEIKKHESGTLVFLSGHFFTIRPHEVYDLNSEKSHLWEWINEKYEDMDRKFNRAIYEYDGNHFIIYDNNIWGVEEKDGEYGNYYKVKSLIRAFDDDADVNLELLERDKE